MSGPVLDIRELSVWVRSTPAPLRLVDNLSFNIRPGQAVGLVGESGCGKSITAFAIMGLLPASVFTVKSAGILLNGMDISRLGSARRRRILGREITMVFQRPGTALDPVFTIGQQIIEVLQRHTEKRRKPARQLMLEALLQVGFEHPGHIASTYPHQLSGGMRQLAMIAMATVCEPAVLIADEPTTALDPGATALILHQLKRLQTDYGTAVLLISHDLAAVRKNCQKALIMYCGRIIEAAESGRLFAQPRHPYSAGLLACIPQITSTRPETIHSIPGQVPMMTDLPGGCHFAPRCNRVDAHCRESIPTLESDDAAGAIACFRPL